MKKIYKAMFEGDRAFQRDCKIHGEDFGLNCFNDHGPVPIILFVPETKITVQPVHVLRTAGFTNTELYKAYRDVVNRVKTTKVDPRAAMFFPIKHMTNFVLHNVKELGVAVNTNVVMRLGKDNSELRIEPLSSFIESIALRYS